MLDSNKSGELTAVASQYVKEGEYWIWKLSGELVRAAFPYDKSYTEGTAGVNRQAMTFTITGACWDRLLQISKAAITRCICSWQPG